MSPKKWFLIEVQFGRAVIVTGMFDSFDEAKKVWDDNPRWIICETVYG